MMPAQRRSVQAPSTQTVPAAQTMPLHSRGQQTPFAHSPSFGQMMPTQRASAQAFSTQTSLVAQMEAPQWRG